MCHVVRSLIAFLSHYPLSSAAGRYCHRIDLFYHVNCVILKTLCGKVFLVDSKRKIETLLNSSSRKSRNLVTFSNDEIDKLCTESEP